MIARDPAAAASRRYDLIVIGGGIYGACIAFEAVKRGLQPLLIERDDFGGATSWNSLRIIHGGLRYLQSLDIKRHFESVQERRWFLRTFPELVQPLPCLMPLFSNANLLKRPFVLRTALRINDVLSCRRNVGVNRDRRLADGRILSAVDARLRCPGIPRDGLCGAALWHDAMMISPQRIIMAILRTAADAGATLLNYVEGVSIVTSGGKVAGVAAVDRARSEVHEFRAPIVINAGGPWCGRLARQFHAAPSERSSLFRPSLAYNLLLNRPPIADCAVAVQGRKPGSRVYFLYANSSGLLAGTEHAPIAESDEGSPAYTGPTPEQIQRTLDRLNDAVDGLNLSQRDVLRVYWGVLPARRERTDALARWPVVCDHGRAGGPRGVYSVSGVKFTTARLVAEKVVKRLPVNRSKINSREIDAPFSCPTSVSGIDLISPHDVLQADEPTLRHALTQISAEESVVRPDDLLLRRTNWLDDPRCESAIRERIERILPQPPEQAKASAMNSAPRLMDSNRTRVKLPSC